MPKLFIILVSVAMCLPWHHGIARAEEAVKPNPEFSRASAIVGSGAISYFQIFGRYPATFAEVRAAGIVQAPIVSEEGEVIDPDDTTLDFVGDVRYLAPSGSEGRPRVAVLVNFGGYNTRYDPFGTDTTYADLYDILEEQAQDKPGLLERMPEPTEARLKQLAIASICNWGLTVYQWKYRRAPDSCEEFMASGFCPVNADSVNPLTGQPFAGDGRANDLHFVSYGDHAFVTPVKADGSTDYPITLL